MSGLPFLASCKTKDLKIEGSILKITLGFEFSVGKIALIEAINFLLAKEGILSVNLSKLIIWSPHFW